jgi:hypothetical protein
MGTGVHHPQPTEAAPPDYRLKASISDPASQAARREQAHCRLTGKMFLAAPILPTKELPNHNSALD